ncbi:MAG: hypothetical protein ASUL_01350 [Candidatus Aramenus sulfurataquae]|jgi:inner membrane protein involved in colicin E2 resistance|uniref:Uncharacterized protein n=2 Tax=Candidatus Aramenus sulfurataquae TaxID=1326980 RepID=W7KZM2_9CREN|nr:MAG: hypothetical protein ASUL_01350 [Candidatus Aramenus sulfurataquae]MCL7344319.1 hypothetical protein [Candidatus Aramenus sulfurataquae]
MNLIEEALLIIGLAMMPYGLYEIVRGEGDRQVKVLLIGTSLALFIIEFILAYR